MALARLCLRFLEPSLWCKEKVGEIVRVHWFQLPHSLSFNWTTSPVARNPERYFVIGHRCLEASGSWEFKWRKKRCADTLELQLTMGLRLSYVTGFSQLQRNAFQLPQRNFWKETRRTYTCNQTFSFFRWRCESHAPIWDRLDWLQGDARGLTSLHRVSFQIPLKSASLQKGWTWPYWLSSFHIVWIICSIQSCESCPILLQIFTTKW